MLQAVLRTLLAEEPVFAFLTQQFTVVWDKKGERVNTAAVCITANHEIQLILNTEYFSNLPFYEQVGLIYHECSHLILDHLSQYHLYDPKIANIAMDVEIDQKIPRQFRFAQPLLPITVKPLNNSLDNQNFIYYIDEFIKNKGDSDKYENKPKGGGAPGSGQPGSGGGSGDPTEGQRHDEHSIWTETPQLSPSTKSNIIKSAVNLARQEAKRNSYGQISGNVEMAINALLKPAKVPWYRVLANMIGSAISINPQNTRTRPNKKLGYLAAGQKDGTSPSLLVFVDISGSHHDELFKKSFEQIKTILEDYQDEIRVFFFSDGIFPEVFLADAKLTHAPKRPGSGGTSFGEIFKKASEYDDVDAIIILTDGDAPCPSEPPARYKIIWGLTDGDRTHLTFGQKVLIGDE